MSKVESNSTVTVHYTGKFEDGSIFDTSHLEGRTPITAKLGEGALIPGFESGLIGMEVGEQKTVEIEPENAYGLINPELVGEVTKDKVAKIKQLLETTPWDAIDLWMCNVARLRRNSDASSTISGLISVLA